jgi:hypothetical protein
MKEAMFRPCINPKADERLPSRTRMLETARVLAIREGLFVGMSEELP